MGAVVWWGFVVCVLLLGTRVSASEATQASADTATVNRSTTDKSTADSQELDEQDLTATLQELVVNLDDNSYWVRDRAAAELKTWLRDPRTLAILVEELKLLQADESIEAATKLRSILTPHLPKVDIDTSELTVAVDQAAAELPYVRVLREFKYQVEKQRWLSDFNQRQADLQQQLNVLPAGHEYGRVELLLKDNLKQFEAGLLKHLASGIDGAEPVIHLTTSGVAMHMLKYRGMLFQATRKEIHNNRYAAGTIYLHAHTDYLTEGGSCGTGDILQSERIWKHLPNRKIAANGLDVLSNVPVELAKMIELSDALVPAVQLGSDEIYFMGRLRKGHNYDFKRFDLPLKADGYVQSKAGTK